MKKSALFLLLCLTLLFLTSCWDRMEIDDVTLMTGIALDKKNETEIEVTVNFYVPKVLGGEQGTGGAVGESLVRTGEGATIAACGVVSADHSEPEAHLNFTVTGESVVACVWPALCLEVPLHMSRDEPNPPRKTLYEMMQIGNLQMAVGGIAHIELVEGGMTRLAVFYYSKTPRHVGPVRSMRATDIGIVKPAEGALIASGGAPPTVRRVDAAGIDAFTEGAKGYVRAPDRSAPYNLMMRLPALAKSLKAPEPPENYLPWGSADDFPKGQNAKAIAAQFSGGHTTNWRYAGGATGQHHVPSTGRNARGEMLTTTIPGALRGLGVKWIKTIDSYRIPDMIGTLREALTTRAPGLKVIIAKGECMLERQRRERPKKRALAAAGKTIEQPRFGVDPDVCTGDHSCMRFNGCPSLTLRPSPDPLREDPIAHVDETCVGCGVCGEVAHAAVLCPSFYEVRVVSNPSRWTRMLSRLRMAVIRRLASAPA